MTDTPRATAETLTEEPLTEAALEFARAKLRAWEGTRMAGELDPPTVVISRLCLSQAEDLKIAQVALAEQKRINEGMREALQAFVTYRDDPNGIVLQGLLGLGRLIRKAEALLSTPPTAGASDGR